MSRNHMESITCPNCKKESEIIMWDSINTMLDPDMKEKVRSGEAFNWTCPACGYETKVNYATLYHQMEDDVMIYYVPGDKTQAVEMMKGIFRNEKGEMVDFDLKLDADYRKRVVGTMNEFREKIMILDAGLDDRVIELMKLILRMTFEKDDPDLEIDEFLYLEEDGEKTFILNLGDGKWGGTAFDQDMYDKVAADFKDILQEDKEVIINLDWAVKIINERLI